MPTSHRSIVVQGYVDGVGKLEHTSDDGRKSQRVEMVRQQSEVPVREILAIVQCLLVCVEEEDLAKKPICGGVDGSRS